MTWWSFFLALATWCAAALSWGLYLVRPYQPESVLVMESLAWLGMLGALALLAGVWLRYRPGDSRCPSNEISWWQACVSCVSIPVLLQVKPPPERTVLFIAGFLAVWLIGRASRRRIVVGLGRIGLHMGIGLAAARWLVWHVRLKPDFPGAMLARPAGMVLQWFGYPVAVEANMITVQRTVFVVDQVKSGLLISPFFILPFCALLWVVGCDWRRRAAGAAVGAAAAMVLLFVRMVWLITRSAAGMFPSPSGLFSALYWAGGGGADILLWLLVLVPVWGVLLAGASRPPVDVPAGGPAQPPASKPPAKKHRRVRHRAWAMISLAGALTIWAGAWWCWGWNTFVPFTLYVDETHSAWEPSYVEHGPDSSFDPENNYRLLLERLSRSFEVGILLPEQSAYPVSGRLPARVKVIHCAPKNGQMYLNLPVNAGLIVKCPTREYSKQEIVMIEQFVRRGGRLLLIGEHSNAFFMNDHLSVLAGRFGITFRRDSVYGISGSWPVSTRADVRSHAVTRPMAEFMWATPASLRVAPPAKTLILSPPAGFTDSWNPHRRNFFGDLSPGAGTRFGSVPLAAVCRYGNGKVLAFADSTSFNNYMLNTYGREAFIDGLLGWFGAGPSFNYLIPLAVGLSLGHLFLLRRSGMRAGEWRTRAAALLIPAVALGACFGMSLTETASGEIFSLRAESPPCLLVDISRRSRRPLMAGSHTEIMGPDSYDRFFLAVSRTGEPVSFIKSSPLSASELNRGRVLLLVAPSRRYRRLELKSIRDFVERGGRLVLIEGRGATGAINDVAGLFGLRFRTPGGFGPAADSGCALPSTTVVDGGRPLLVTGGLPVISRAESGSGFVLAIGDDALFSARRLRGDRLSRLRPLLCEMIHILFRGTADDLTKLDWQQCFE